MHAFRKSGIACSGRWSCGKAAVLVIILVFATLCAGGCSTTGSESEEAGPGALPPGKESLTVAVTIVPQQTFVEIISGGKAETILLVPPGYSPASYEPGPAEMEALKRARLYFSVGVPAEEANILPRVREQENLEVISLVEPVSSRYPDRLLPGGGRDPHIWLSPKRARVMVETMAREMARVDEANGDFYLENARRYQDELLALEQELKLIFEDLPNGRFIVFHPAFGYLADDFNLEMYALEEGGREATPRRLQEMVDLARAENIRVIFHQREIDSRQSQAFAEEIGGETVLLAPLAPDYIDNLRLMAETMARTLR